MLTTSLFWDLAKRLQAFGLVALNVENKLSENVSLGLNNVYLDQMRTAFGQDEIYQSERALIEE